MARSEPAIFTNMCMVYDHDGNILVQVFEDGHLSEFFYHQENGKGKVKLL